MPRKGEPLWDMIASVVFSHEFMNPSSTQVFFATIIGCDHRPLRTRARPALWTSERRVANVSPRTRGRLFSLVL